MQILSEHSFWLLIKASWQAAVLIVVVMVMQWLLGGRLTPRWRFRLWLLVALRLAMPWTVPSALSLFNVLKFSSVPPSAEALKVEAFVPDSAIRQLAQHTAPEPALQLTLVSSEAVAPKFSLRHVWFPLVWAAGASVVLLGLGVNHIRFHRKVARNRPLIDEKALNLLEDCKYGMGIRTPVTLVETAAVDGPALFGFLRPRILLPPEFTSSFSHDELRFVFLHELGHVKRHDILLGWLMAVLQVLHWFNPFVWVAFARMRVDRELACDAVALSYTDDHEHKPYGLTIVKLLEHFSNSLRAPSLAGIVEDKQQMKERITMIAKFHKTDRGLALAGCLFAGLALVTLTDAQNAGNPATADLTQRRGAVTELRKQSAVEVAQAQTPQADNGWDLDQKLKMAEAGNKWAAYDLWDAYYRGHHGIQPDQAKADKWLGELVRDLWVVRFEPIDAFAPTTPGEFLTRIDHYSSSRSGYTNIGTASFFRTTKQGHKLVGSFLSNYPNQLKASLKKVPGVKVISVKRITREKFVSYEQSPQESLTDTADRSPASSSGASSEPPRIISTVPSIGATDVDPALSEITVTFDQDMGDGMSWTGGGPEFPPTLEGQRAQWGNKRTCALPVKLESAHYYRVGINSTSYQNFANQHGVAALPSAIFFTTQGASEQLKARTVVPKVVRCDPDNGAQNVSPAVTELRVTFSVPMGGGCSWCTAGDDDSDFPKGVEGKRYYWTEDKKTCVLPVTLKPRMAYRISLNAPGYINFQSEGGVPLNPVAYSFKTTDSL